MKRIKTAPPPTQAFTGLAITLGILLSAAAKAEEWGAVRAAPSASGAIWSEVPCEPGPKNTWQLCQPPLEMSVSASPSSIAGLPTSTSDISVTIRDMLGNLVEAGVPVSWSTTRGTLSSTKTYTDATGRTSVTLTAWQELGGATVTANAASIEGGSGSVFIGFIDSWIATTSTYTDWANSGGLYGCENWSPDPSTVDAGQAFTQTATDCEQNQTQEEQKRLISQVTGSIQNDGAPITLSQILYNQTAYQDATGSRATASDCPSKSFIWYWSGSDGASNIRPNGLCNLPEATNGTVGACTASGYEPGTNHYSYYDLYSCSNGSWTPSNGIECRYDNNNYVLVNNSTLTGLWVEHLWDGSSVSSGELDTTVTVGSYTYSAGSVVEGPVVLASNEMNKSQICRQPK